MVVTKIPHIEQKLSLGNETFNFIHLSIKILHLRCLSSLSFPYVIVRNCVLVWNTNQIIFDLEVLVGACWLVKYS